MDNRPAMLLLRSFRDTALQQAPSRVNPLVLAAAVAVLPLPLAQFAYRRGEERYLIGALDSLFEATARIMMLRPRSAPSAFTMFSSLLEIEVADERWEEAVVALAHRSSAVLLMPSASAGVVREAELLRTDAGLLARTVVVLPPVDKRRFTSYQRHPAKEWSGVQEAWRAAGLNLPPYPESGIAYVPAPDFSVLRARSLAGSVGELVPAVAELLEPGAQNVPASSAVGPSIS